MAKDQVFATAGQRAGALMVDLVLGYLSALALGQILAPEFTLPLIVMLFLAYRGAMPATRLQGTVGQWASRIKVVNRETQQISWPAAAIRGLGAALWCGAWLLFSPRDLTLLTMGQGYWVFLYALLLTLPWYFLGHAKGQTLFDIAARTWVVKRAVNTTQMAEALETALPLHTRIGNISGAVIACLLFAFMVWAVEGNIYLRDRLTRLGYAVLETQELREHLLAFHAAQQRWPQPEEVGALARRSYPAGGGYQLQAEGRIAIGFSVLPDLKGRTIEMTPEVAGKEFRWRCRWTDGKAKPQLPRACT